MSETRFRFAAVAIGLAIAGTALIGCDRSKSEGAPAQGGPGGPGGPGAAAQVAVVTVASEKVVLTTELPGRASSFMVSDVRPQVSGLIQKRLFEEGSDVKAGQVLYQIDPAPFEAAYQSALATLDAARKSADRAKAGVGASEAALVRQQATLKLAQTNAKRLEELYKERAVAESQRDQAVTDVHVAEATLQVAEAQIISDKAAVAAAEAAVKQAQAAVDASKINLGYTKVLAPIAGRIGRSSVTEGATVTAYQPLPLATIQQLDPVYVDVPQSTAEMMRLQRSVAAGHITRSGDDLRDVKLLLDDGSVYGQKGTLKFRDVSVDPTTGSVILRIVAPNPDGLLLPGMFIRAVIEQGVSENAILVPQQTVSRDPRGNPFVLIVGAGSKAELRQVVTERAIGDRWLVTSGLAAGDQVIIEGLQRIRPGVPVSIVQTPVTAPSTTAAAKTN